MPGMLALRSPLWPLLFSFSWQELRHHPWRNAAAVVSVMLGVALAFSVHLINASALDEFAQAARSVGGQPDLELRSSAANGRVDEAVLQRLQPHPQVASASPVLEASSYALAGAAAQRTPLRLVGVDALQVAAISPDLLPCPTPAKAAWRCLRPTRCFSMPAPAPALPGASLRVQRGLQLPTLQVAGSVRASGAPLAVMDIAALQDFLDQAGQLSRVDLRLRAGVDRLAFARELQASPGWPQDVRLLHSADAPQRINDLSRAYRVNLTVLALVALFTGAFLVYSVLALSVARRAQQFALLGVLGLTGRQRLALVVLEATLLGAVGSGLGLAAGRAALARLGAAFGWRRLGRRLLQRVGRRRCAGTRGAACGLWRCLGIGCCAAGRRGWPARRRRGLPPAQTLEGPGRSWQGRGAGAAGWPASGLAGCWAGPWLCCPGGRCRWPLALAWPRCYWAALRLCPGG